MAQTSTVVEIAGEDGGESEQKSSIACQTCRRRKVKCSRELPHCRLCITLSLECSYPSEIRRPGPKVGSTQKKRKRQAQQDCAAPAGPSDKSPRLSREGREASSPALSVPNGTGGTAIQQATVSPSAAEHPLSPAPSETASTPNMHSLSFILHPSHESCSPEDQANLSSAATSPNVHCIYLEASCQTLGIEPAIVDDLVVVYLQTFTAFQLFREVDLKTKLRSIGTLTQTKALLAVVLAFAAKSLEGNNVTLQAPVAYASLSATYLGNLAKQFVDAAIAECDDNSIPLSLLQALILLTHWFLIQGVRAKAWRYLGTCVRSAYELNLHLVDRGRTPNVETVDSARWCEDEERRRAWWAIWEMDVFASVIRRCPVGIDWSQNETFLPAEDELWNQGKAQKSCYLDCDLADRWKTLSGTGNESPKAWFLVMNSYVKDAQRITCPTGLDQPTREHRSGNKDAASRLVAVLNNIHCASSALPAKLKFRCQHLHFGSREEIPHQAAAVRLQHAYIYSIHCMIHLARLMTYRYWIFHGSRRWQRPAPRHMNLQTRGEDDSYRCHGPLGSSDRGPSSLEAVLALDQYFESADEIYTLVRRSHEDHYRNVNPYLANTIWLAGAVQLFYKRLAPSTATDRALIVSNFHVLNMTYKKFLEHWQMSNTLQKTLEIVEKELNGFEEERGGNISLQDDVLALLGRRHLVSYDNAVTHDERLAGQRRPMPDGHNHMESEQADNVSVPLRQQQSQETQAIHNVLNSVRNQTVTTRTSFLPWPLSEQSSGALRRDLTPQGAFDPEILPQTSLDQILSFVNAPSATMLPSTDYSPISPIQDGFTNYLDEMLSGSYMTI